MKKLTSVLLILLSFLMVASAMTIGVGASSAYQTYTYSIDGKALYSPDAYSAVDSVDSVDSVGWSEGSVVSWVESVAP